MSVEIRLLGGFHVLVDDQQIPAESWRRRDAAALVKLLALAKGRRLLRDLVLDALWPELLIEQAAPRLHKAAHYARTTLGVHDSVVLSGDAVALFPHAQVSVDTTAFDQAAAAARSGDMDRAREAVGLYAGDLLPDDLYEPWTEQERERRRLQFVELLYALGSWDRVLEVDPVDEHAHLQLAHEHLRREDRHAALAQLDLMAQVLQRELGAEPSDGATALREEILATPIDLVAWEPRFARRAPVPRPQTPTVGRDRDMELLVEMLEDSQIVTLLGPGGVGKTRLAIEVAARHVEVTSVDACFVDLTRVSDAEAVPGLIARDLGIHLEAGSQTEAALDEALRGRSLLIVLDNFEHVVDSANIVGRIARYSPNLKMLVTSRARLQIVGEHIFDVSPLSLEPQPAGAGATGRPADAVALFEQVASEVDREFRLTPNLTDVESICRTVDGLPLAIELAARHVRTLPPPLLRARLAARLGSPTGAARDLPPRQQTIPATIDWSLQLLGTAEQAMFTRLGVFAGAVPIEAVEQVCGEPGEDVVDALSRLSDQSLVRRVTGPRGETRFMLLELLRERARELLTGPQEAEVRDRHAGWVASFLDELEQQRWVHGRWLDEMAAGLAEIRAAHDWAEQRGNVQLAARITAGLGAYWHREGHHVEGRSWVSSALDHESELDALLVARLHLAAGVVEWPRDQLVARAHWTRATEDFRTLGHERYLSYSMALAAVTHVGMSETYDFGLALCEEGLNLARRVGDPWLIARALNMKGELARVHGDDSLALDSYQEGREIAIATHDDGSLGMFLGNLSFLADHRGEYEEARRLSREALGLCWSLGRRMLAAWMMSELAGAELGLGSPELGARLVGASDRALSLLGVERHPCDVPEYERVVAGLREALGEEAFQDLHTGGTTMSLDEAVALALAEPDITGTID